MSVMRKILGISPTVGTLDCTPPNSRLREYFEKNRAVNISRVRGRGGISVNATVEIENPTSNPQDPLVVHELLTQKVIENLRYNRLFNGREIDYTYYQAWEDETKQDKTAGFAIYARNPKAESEEKQLIHVMDVTYKKLDLESKINDKLTEDQKNFLAGWKERDDLIYKLEVPSKSPLDYQIKQDSSNEGEPKIKNIRGEDLKSFGGLVQLIEDLNDVEDIQSKVLMPREFYEQFKGKFNHDDYILYGKIKKRLEEREPIRYLNQMSDKGRNLLFVVNDDNGEPEFFRGNYKTSPKNTPEDEKIICFNPLIKGSSIEIPTNRIIAIYGKGLREPIYEAQNMKDLDEVVIAENNNLFYKVFPVQERPAITNNKQKKYKIKIKKN